MGYDPYDSYDLADFSQKGGTKTSFGNKGELMNLIASAHTAGMQVYADMVTNHNSGGDAAEPNPIDGKTRWTIFTPACGFFPRNWLCFHPSSYESYDEMSFGDMPDLCQRDPTVYTQMIAIAQFLIEQVGFDGFRFDFVKGYGPWMVKAIAEVRYLNKAQQGFKPFCVGECWDIDPTISDWLSEVNTFMDNPVSAFDFPLHYRLKRLCDSYGFSLTDLAQGGVMNVEQPAHAVTFVDNHDTTRDPSNAIINDKMLAYAFILTHEGYPCVFWRDYFNYGLARAGTANAVGGGFDPHLPLQEPSILRCSYGLFCVSRPVRVELTGTGTILPRSHAANADGSKRTEPPILNLGILLLAASSYA